MFSIHFYWDVELEELTREKAIITAIQMDRQGHWLILVTWRLYFLFMSQDYLRAPIKPYSALDDLFSGLPRNRRLISKWIKDIQFEQFEQVENQLGTYNPDVCLVVVAVDDWASMDQVILQLFAFILLDVFLSGEISRKVHCCDQTCRTCGAIEERSNP